MMIRKTIRVRKYDSAFVYAIFESLEGMLAYSTLPELQTGQDFRDLDLLISEGFQNEVEEVLNGFRKKFPVLELEDRQER